MGAVRRTYHKVPCICGREVSRNALTRHQRACESYQSKLRENYERSEVVRKEGIQNAPIHTLNLGQVIEAGRMDELKKWLNTNEK